MLHNDGEIQDTLKILTEKGMTYELDGALWYKATDFGAEKDEVLVGRTAIPPISPRILPITEINSSGL